MPFEHNAPARYINAAFTTLIGSSMAYALLAPTAAAERRVEFRYPDQPNVAYGGKEGPKLVEGDTPVAFDGSNSAVHVEEAKQLMKVRGFKGSVDKSRLVKPTSASASFKTSESYTPSPIAQSAGTDYKRSFSPSQPSAQYAAANPRSFRPAPAKAAYQPSTTRSFAVKQPKPAHYQPSNARSFDVGAPAQANYKVDGYHSKSEMAKSLPKHIKIGAPYQIDGKWYVPAHEPDYDRVGVASWYGPKYHGKKTANGETFNMHDISAAHPTLPIPSMVRVTNLENGEELMVRINDRGPFAADRIIDLSKAAAEALGFEENGTAQVRVKFLGLDTGGAPTYQAKAVKTPSMQTMASLDAGQSMRIQAGAFSSPKNAAIMADNLADIGQVDIEPINRNGKTLYKVLVGSYTNRGEAEQMRARVAARSGSSAMLVKT